MRRDGLYDCETSVYAWTSLCTAWNGDCISVYQFDTVILVFHARDNFKLCRKQGWRVFFVKWAEMDKTLPSSLRIGADGSLAVAA